MQHVRGQSATAAVAENASILGPAAEGTRIVSACKAAFQEGSLQHPSALQHHVQHCMQFGPSHGYLEKVKAGTV